jgi:hypothetical protein
MAKKRDISYDPNSLAWMASAGLPNVIGCTSDVRPLTHIQALMEEIPGGPSALPPLEETLLLKETLAEAFEHLTPEDRWIAERLLIEGLSLRKTGAVLGIPKTTLARRRDKICLRLVDVLVDSPVVREWMRN